MPRARVSLVLVTVLSVWTARASAQQAPIEPDSARAQIQATLRAFYFNLEHRDWEALTADILAAKVVASRAVPKTLLADRPASRALRCTSKSAALVGQAAITLEGDWAGVSVARCTVTTAGTDEFRLIHFQERWRFIYIDLYDGTFHVTVDR